jgi:hypothetical protein
MRADAGVRATAVAALALAMAALTSCAPATPATTTPSLPAAPSASEPQPAAGIELPPSGGVPDYQLGTPYEPDARVQIVTRDREAPAADGLYSICYVNGFQTQPGELDAWPAEALLTVDGEPLIDPDWPDEVILDTSSPETRAAIAEIVGPWIEGCADAGYRAVEFDNLDTFTRTDGALSLADNLALATDFVDIAHDAGLAAGQKNAAEFAAELRDEAGFDFAVSEECSAFEECASYAEVYGGAVIDIEYTDALPRPFAEMCADADAPASMVLRDRQLSSPEESDYAFELC